ncbi:DUF2846 domain-containing protein [Pseudomonas putida CSV86]|uniref:DUF2846 domain-containing protein n=1 Tax=Pseudomonas bharatica CSV86 TaxID=1005395 RepID=L1M580_9PSED|nr:DUF2846 domain-containing protein [Pseudomonas bharatica]NNJ15576.1 DUF2846 domain-containing protein [Pseudomonas bharatica CSV86]
MRILIAGLALMAVAGCATSPIPAEQADPVPSSRLFAFQSPSKDQAVIVVTRDTGFTGGGCNTKVSIDGRRAAEIGPGETAKFYVSPGERMLSASSCGSGLKERETTIQPGGTKRFRISIDSAMSLDLSPTAY